MRNFFLLSVMSFVSIPNNGKEFYESHNAEIIGTIEVMLPTVVGVEMPVLDFGLGDMKNMISFIKYIKTQSSTLTSENSRADVYFVIQTMYNRFKHKKCSWRKYYNTPSLNNSQSIKRLKSGRLKQYFNWDDPSDKELYNIAYSCNIGSIEDKYKIPEDVLYFESFKKAPNRGPHLLVNFYAKRRHRFYKYGKNKKLKKV